MLSSKYLLSRFDLHLCNLESRFHNNASCFMSKYLCKFWTSWLFHISLTPGAFICKIPNIPNIKLLYSKYMYSAPSVYRPPFYRQNSRLSRFPPLKIPRYTAKLSYRHPPQVFRHKSRKTNLNSPVSTTHNYLLTAVYWSVIMECQNWSSDTVIDLIVEGRNRWSVVLIRIITCIYFSSDYICTFNPD